MTQESPPSREILVHLLSEYELADLLGVPISTVRRWRLVKQGPPFLKLARSVHKYRTEDVLRWLETRLRGGEPLTEAQ